MCCHKNRHITVWRLNNSNKRKKPSCWFGFILHIGQFCPLEHSAMTVQGVKWMSCNPRIRASLLLVQWNSILDGFQVQDYLKFSKWQYIARSFEPQLFSRASRCKTFSIDNANKI